MLVIIRRESEAAAMVRWGVRFAVGRGSRLDILWIEEGKGQADVEWQSWGSELLEAEPYWNVIADALAEAGSTQIRLARHSVVRRSKAVLQTVKKIQPSLLIVGRHDSAKDGSPYGKLARDLLEDADCAVLVLRLGSESMENQKILVPCAGGQHSKLGLSLASSIAGADAVALFIEPNVDEVSHDVGYGHLIRYVNRAGLKTEDVSSKVVVSDSVSEGIAGEINSGEYGLLLIGATGAGTMRKSLFGTVQGRLMTGERAMSIGVVRAARPVGQRVRYYFEDFLKLRIPQLGRTERISLFNEMESKSRWSFDFAVLMILATSIASLGLLADSGAVVIGAMLVAPLMTPLLGGGLALVQGNMPLWQRCQKAVGLGFLSALIVGFISGLFARFVQIGITGELEARGAPTLLDLGVAFISGIAASYCMARPKLTGALAGVAIAAALVPPISTTGIGLAMGEFELAKGAALLFGTNVVAIVLGSACNFYSAGVRGRSATDHLLSRRIFIGFTLIGIGLMVPLTSILASKVAQPLSSSTMLHDVLDDHGYHLVSARRTRENGDLMVVIVVEGAQPVDATVLSQLKVIAQEYYKQEVRLKVSTRLVLESDV
ncbi:DUF389 domain-containing protein [Persicirhabdus sediminis]|uniref:DUF389 domain-containing protein n=1 Tax=Persicirhabdus sediminis TaxID=454144 RepID=A0A8J7MF67_9BACT|nr:DUF389 domain-containing protein [Persicirhabdus sediminis]MBK1791877.1 DUF389 domain-containing protein [Persicirhabdus sediminis]